MYSNSKIQRNTEQIDPLITEGINPGHSPFSAESQQPYHPALPPSLVLWNIAELEFSS